MRALGGFALALAVVGLITAGLSAVEVPRRDFVADADTTGTTATINGVARTVSQQTLASFDVPLTTDSLTIAFEDPGNNVVFFIYDHPSPSYDLTLSWPSSTQLHSEFIEVCPATRKIVKPDDPIYVAIYGRLGGTLWDGTKPFYQYWHEYFPSEGVVTIDMDVAAAGLLQDTNPGPGGSIRVNLPYAATVFFTIAYDNPRAQLPVLQWPGGATLYQRTWVTGPPTTLTIIPDISVDAMVVLAGSRGAFQASSGYRYMQMWFPA